MRLYSACYDLFLLCANFVVIVNAFTIFSQGSNAEIFVGIFLYSKLPENYNETLALTIKHLWMSEIYELLGSSIFWEF